MTKKIIIMWNYVSIGGVETLILRLAKFFQRKNIDVILACNTYQDCKDNAYIERLKALDVIIVELKRLKDDNMTNVFCIKNLLPYINESTLIITFNYFEFYLAQNIKQHKKNNTINIIFYVVHPTLHTCKDLYFPLKSKLARRIVKKYYKMQIMNLYKRNYIFFMDEDCIKTSEKHFNIDLKKSYDQIIRLPIEIKPEKKKQQTANKFSVLTISRFDFPFKGYILGVIKVIYQLKKDNKNIQLTIIGDGRDKKEVIKQIKKYNLLIDKDVFLEGNVSYENLESYFDMSDLYVGMGTTLLDASSNSVPSIIADAYSYEADSIGFFHQHVNHVCGLDDKVDKKKKIKTLIENTIDLDSCEYSLLSHKAYESIKPYEISFFVKNILEIKNFKNKKACNNLIVSTSVIYRKIICFIKKYFLRK